MGKKRSNAAADNGAAEAGVLSIDSARLQVAKEVESQLESSRLSFEEAKAKYAMARAEHKFLVVRRNITISTASDPKDVEDAQRVVDNAKNREAMAKSVRDAAKDEWKGTEERLAKVLTEVLPLFDLGGSSNGQAFLPAG